MTASGTGPIILDGQSGSGIALDEAEKRTAGRMQVFLAAGQFVEPGAVLALASCFANPRVVAVRSEPVPHHHAIVSESAFWD